MNTEKRPKVLIVDDEEELRQLISDHLELEGYECHQLDNGLLALEQVKSNDIQVVISDIRMPKCDGITFIKSVIAENIDVPIILITGYSDIKNEAEAKAIGAFGFLSKPFNFHTLVNLVESAINKK